MHQRYLDTGALLSVAQASPSLRPPAPPSPSPTTPTRSLSSGNFHQFPVFSSSSSSPLSPTLKKGPEKRPSCSPPRRSPPRLQKGGRDGCEHGYGSGSSALTLRRNRCTSGQEGTGGARQVLDEAAAHECSCQNVCVSSPVMTC